MTERKKRSIFMYIMIAARGVAMGAADVVPGVSGGTMAFILGIYEELIEAIRKIASADTVKMLCKLQFKKAYDELPWRFLLALGMGILSAIFLLSTPIKWMLENHPVLIWAFFFGLVMASVLTVLKRVKKWNASALVAVVIGAVFAYWIVGVVPRETPDTWWFLTLSGTIAICAMILPGISGSFILLLMGKYEYILGAVHNIKGALKSMDVAEVFGNGMIIFWVAVGAVIGLCSFVRLLSWLFRHYHDLTVALLIGFMVGSLRKVWPWKEAVITKIINDKPRVLVENNVLPSSFNSYFWYAVLLALAGLVLVIVLEYLANRKENIKHKATE
ncbi:MAG: DUF368 domain-containing protein [Victivallales bacterium]|nr:DUF368 domain-containing protein [Victivallales bacterium]